MSKMRWIPVTKKLPDDLEEVFITYMNIDPEEYSYGELYIPFSAAAVFCDERWYWWTSNVRDILEERGKCEGLLIDDCVKITAWMPLPEPYKER